MPRFTHKNGTVINVPAEKGKKLGPEWAAAEKPAPKPRAKKDS